MIPKELSSDLKLFILGFIFLQMGEVVFKKIASINDLQSYFRIICISPFWEMCILSNAKTVTPKDVLDELLKGPFMNLYTE